MALCAIDPRDFDTCSSSPCLPGFYGDSPDLADIYCSGLCTAGHYCDAQPIITPTPCPRGTFFPSQGANNASLCAECFPGQYQPNAGQALCLSCEIGTYSAAYGSTECDSCPAGGYCPSAAAGSVALAFTPCPAGRFNSATGSRSSAECEVCAPGWYNARVGSNSSRDCRLCRPGTFSGREGSPLCAPCDPGSFQNDAGATECKVCSDGYYCTLGSAAPLPCPGGTHKNVSLAVMTTVEQCVMCPAGTFCSVGSDAATPCAPGSYNNLESQTTCISCAPGAYQDVAGGTACKQCPRYAYGRIRIVAAAIQILGYSDAYRRALRRRGTYAANAGQGLCIPCPHRLSAPESATSCSVCDVAFYLRNESVDRSELILQPDLHCVDCPRYANCSWNTTLSTLGVPRNHWRSSFFSDELAKCPDQGDVDDSACLGSAANTSSADSGYGDPYCKLGHRGPRCETCVSSTDYYDDQEHGCVSCPGASRLVVYMAVAFGLCTVVGTCFRLYMRRAREHYRRQARRFNIAAAAIGLQAKFKIILSFFQVSVTLSRALTHAQALSARAV